MSVKVCKNKMLLSFLSVLLVVQLITSAFFVPRVNAALPLAAPLAAALGSLMIDTAIDMGIRFIDEKAKTDFKNTAVNDIWSKYGDEIKDLKPTKKNAGKWLLEIPKWLTGVAVDYIADKAVDIAKGDAARRQTNKDIFKTTDISYEYGDPFYNTGVSLAFYASSSRGDSVVNNRRYLGYLMEWLDIRVKPIAYGQRTQVTFAWRGDFDKGFNLNIAGGYKGPVFFYFEDLGDGVLDFNFFVGDDSVPKEHVIYLSSTSDKQTSIVYQRYRKNHVNGNTLGDGIPSYLVYLEKLENSYGKIFYSDGMLTTAGYDAYLNFPNKTADGQTILYKPEAIGKVEHQSIKPIELEFELKDLNLVSPEWNEVKEGDKFEWEIIKNEVENQVTNNTFNTTNYTINNYNQIDYNTVINNYYTTENEIVIADKDKEDDDNNKGTENGEIEIEDGDVEIEDGDVKIDEADIEINDAVIEIEDDAVINVGDGAVINIEDVDDGFFDKLVGVFMPDDFTFVEQQVKRLMKLINDKLPTADLQDMFNSIFVASEKNPLEDLDIEISSLGLRFDFPDVDDDWIVTLKRVVTAVVVLYTLVYVYRRVFGNNGVMEK